MRARGAGVLVVAVLAAGCGGGSDAGPRVLPSLTSSPSPSPSASAVPTGINAPTPQGAAAFATFVYAEIQRAFETRDASGLQRVSSPSCVSCENFIESVQNIRKQGHRIEGYRIVVRTAVAPADTAATARVDVIRDSSGSVEYDADGRVVSRERALSGIEEQMDLVREGTSWKVTKITRIRIRG